LSNACVNVVCFGHTLAAASACGVAGPLCCLALSILFGMLPLQVIEQVRRVATRHVNRFCANFANYICLRLISCGKSKPIPYNGGGIFLATNSSVWLSAMALRAATATHTNKEAAKKARHCP